MPIITPEKLAVLKTRAIALGWHAGTMLAPVLANFIAANLDLFNLPNWLVVAIGLVLAQVTKYFNTPRV